MAAQTASRLGANVMLVEKQRVGGICPNWGCIPMCFMGHCIEVLKSVKSAWKDGINIGKVEIDFARLMDEKKKVVQGVVAGMEARLLASGVQVVIGAARLTSPNQVEIIFNNGTREIVRAAKIIIATGSLSRRYDIPGAIGPGVFTAKELLNLTGIPRGLAIIGRGVTALELATVWANLGSSVSLIARRPQILPGEDEEISEYIRHLLEDEGVKIYAGAEIESIDDSEEGKSITFTMDNIRQKIEARFAVFALGQVPLIDGLGLENADISTVERRIVTSERLETGISGIYAAGDVTGEKMLASVAMVQGKIAAENALGGDSKIDYSVVPRFIRTFPSIASVGITETVAQEKGRDIKTGSFSFEHSVDASIMKESHGFVKLIADSGSGEILGAHIIGPRASELIHEVAAVMQGRGTIRDIIESIHSHPSLNETIQRAAQTLYARGFSK